MYENYCIIGALLSKQGDTWTIWNTNPTETGYWDPKSDTITTPSTQYGEVVAVCVGRGLWAKIGWSGLTNTYKWAASDSDAIYKTIMLLIFMVMVGNLQITCLLPIVIFIWNYLGTT